MGLIILDNIPFSSFNWRWDLITKIFLGGDRGFKTGTGKSKKCSN